MSGGEAHNDFGSEIRIGPDGSSIVGADGHVVQFSVGQRGVHAQASTDEAAHMLGSMKLHVKKPWWKGGGGYIAEPAVSHGSHSLDNHSSSMSHGEHADHGHAADGDQYGRTREVTHFHHAHLPEGFGKKDWYLTATAAVVGTSAAMIAAPGILTGAAIAAAPTLGVLAWRAIRNNARQHVAAVSAAELAHHATEAALVRPDTLQMEVTVKKNLGELNHLLDIVGINLPETDADKKRPRERVEQAKQGIIAVLTNAASEEDTTKEVVADMLDQTLAMLSDEIVEAQEMADKFPDHDVVQRLVPMLVDCSNAINAQWQTSEGFFTARTAEFAQAAEAVQAFTLSSKRDLPIAAVRALLRSDAVSRHAADMTAEVTERLQDLVDTGTDHIAQQLGKDQDVKITALVPTVEGISLTIKNFKDSLSKSK